MLFNAWDGTAEAGHLSNMTGGQIAIVRLLTPHRQAVAARLRFA